jgi:DNA-binding LacI/PurR family transcriptional regulator
MRFDPVAFGVFLVLTALVTGIGFFASRWRRPKNADSLDEWTLGGRTFGPFITWFLLGGDHYSAYTLIAIPAAIFSMGAFGFYVVPNQVVLYALGFLLMPKLVAVAHKNGYVTLTDYVNARFSSRKLGLAITMTGLLATLPYLALQLVGLEVVFGSLGLGGDAASSWFLRDLPPHRRLRTPWRMPLARRVDGILTLSMPLEDVHTLALRALDIPLVSVGAHVPGSASVRIDEAAAAQSAVNHLIHQGHQRIGFIAGAPDDPAFGFIASQQRRRGYEDAIQTAGLVVHHDLIVAGSHGVHGGAAAMARLLSGPVLPTAVFAEYDELAIGALWALRRASVPVPQMMSVVGIDDHEMAEIHDLTTVAQDALEQGSAAARLLLRALDDHPVGASDNDIVLSSCLVLRGSTAPPRTI